MYPSFAWLKEELSYTESKSKVMYTLLMRAHKSLIVGTAM